MDLGDCLPWLTILSHGACLSFRPGRVVEAEIHRKFGSPVCHDSSSPFPQFLLVVSFGRCKFRLTEENACGYHSPIGPWGKAAAFRLGSLSDLVFRFSVYSPAVVFHVYKLRSFECSQFKVYFHLWHNGGPDHLSEYRRRQLEEASKWTTVSWHSSSSVYPPRPSLTGANRIPVIARCARSFDSNFVNGHGSNGQGGNHGRQSVSTRLKFEAQISAQQLFPINSKKPGILGKRPIGPLNSCNRCLAQTHVEAHRPNRHCCRNCLHWGHFFGDCKFAARSTHLSMDHSRLDPFYMTDGAKVRPRRFISFSEYFHHSSRTL